VLHAVRHRLGLRLQIRTKNLASGVYLVRTREGPVVRSVGISGAEVIKILRNAVGNELAAASGSSAGAMALKRAFCSSAARVQPGPCFCAGLQVSKKTLKSLTDSR
jgi:hypothetical protein